MIDNPHLAAYQELYAAPAQASFGSQKFRPRYYAMEGSRTVCWACLGDHESTACVQKRCYRCAKPGHESSQCQSENYCGNCGGTGHSIPFQCFKQVYNMGLDPRSHEEVQCILCGKFGHINCSLTRQSDERRSEKRSRHEYLRHDGERVISRAEFEKLRSHDPSLSPTGERQVKQLGDAVARALLKPLSPRVREKKKLQMATAVSKVRVAVSPMRRTLLTAVPVVQTLEDLHKKNQIELKSVDIVSHIFEIGGCYSEKSGITMGHKGMTDSEAREILPTAMAPASMSQGWWSNSTRETEEELEFRVTKTLEWIRKTAWEGECDVLFIVTHQDFACTCMRRLTLAPGICWLYNTSLSSFTLHPLVTADMDPERVDLSADGTIARVYHCKVVMDWVNAVEHLSFENLT